MTKQLSIFLLGAMLTAPLGMYAQDRDHDRNDNQQSQRYYDKNSKDWHNWDQNEQQRYHQYLTEHHKKDHDFSRANSRERNDYFRWSHSHQTSDQR